MGLITEAITESRQSDTYHVKRVAYEAFQNGDPDKAMDLIVGLLNEHPDDKTALFMAAEIQSKAHRFGIANPLYRRILELEPTLGAAWNNLGHVLHGQQDLAGSIECGIKSATYGGDDIYSLNHMVLMNSMSGNHANAIRLYRHAKFHAVTPDDHKSADTSAALAYLATGDWPNGWRCFETMLGEMKQRKRHEFHGAPDWDGSPLAPGQTLAVYGEQGIGDEIMFASIIPELMVDAKAGGWKVVIECERRLTNLFARSFGCNVFGTRLVKDQDSFERDWRDGFKFGAKVAIGSLGQFYRPSPSAFPGTPYLTPCPVRAKHVRAALDKLPGRKIGLAWTGGLPSTRGRDRTLSPEAFGPLLDAFPGDTFISLEYKGDASSDPRILHWPDMLQSNDYDDTAGLVSQLNCVVSVTTTVALLAGALGTECRVLAPSSATWHWGASGPCPWFGDHVRLYRRKGVDWASTVGGVVAALCSNPLLAVPQPSPLTLSLAAQ